MSTSTRVGMRRRADPARGLDAVHARHADVHQHDVGPSRARQLDRLGAVAGLADDLDVRRARGSAGSPRGPAPGRRRAGRVVMAAGASRRPRSRRRRAVPVRSSPPWTFDALAHARRARGRRRRGAVRAGPVSRTASSSSSSAPAERASRRGAPRRVLAHVGERLLHDPVGGEVEAGGQLARLAALTSSATGTPAPRARSTSASSCASPGCGRELVAVLLLAQHAEQPPHVARAPRRRSRGSRAAARGRARGRVERGLGRVGLDGDHADAVGDDVVELARDPRALLGDGGLRGALPLRGRQLALGLLARCGRRQTTSGR